MNYVIPVPAVHSIGIAGKDDAFPVNRIFCVGRNYAAHAIEMGMDPGKEAPFFFMKPATALVTAENGQISVPYPPRTANFHHELELVVAIGTGGSDIRPEQSLEHVYGYAIGLDMTRRDLQLQACERGRPWEFGKSFSQSAPIGPLYPVSEVGHISDADISLMVNGETRQSANTRDMICTIPELISNLSQYEPLLAGDLLMTGTPEGVGPVQKGDILRGTVSGLGEIEVTIS